MDCKSVGELLDESPLSDLSPQQRGDVESHLAECQACREKWDAAYQSSVLYDAAKPRRRPRGVRGAVMSRIAGPGRQDAPGSQKGRPSVPERIGGFEVLGLLGRGGMGTVLKARQVTMDRVVALKILPLKLAEDKEFVERFVREAQHAAKLRHPHIVQAYDAGCVDGYDYFAMEYVDGKGLDAILAQDGPLAPARALGIMKQACSALWAAHEAGIIHRDIKPSNIMLDSKGDVRVTDFGLAKRTDGDLAGAPDEAPLGTPAYMAPEVAVGKTTDARSDLYSLGAAFFHVLAGRPPFEGKNLTEVVVKQVKEAPPALGEVAPNVDPRLCRIIDRLLRKDPADRCPSARALLQDLDALGYLAPSGSAPVRSRATAMDAPTRTMSHDERAAVARVLRSLWLTRRRRAALIAAAAVLVCAIVGLAGLLGRGTRQGEEPSEMARAMGLEEPSPVQPPPVDPRESRAESLLQFARNLASQGRWAEAKQQLLRLDEECAHTRFCSAQRVAIARLRARVERGLQPKEAAPPPEALPEVARAQPPKLPEGPGQWVSLFNGQTLDGWRVAEGGEFVGHGPIYVEEGRIVLERGADRAAVAWSGQFPTVDYEVALEARRDAGTELAEILFPVGPTRCAWTVAGWGGTSTGLAMLEGHGGLDNDTRRRATCRTGQWYRARLRVTKDKIEAWLDDEKCIDLPRAGRRLSQPSWLPLSEPFALTTWRSTLSLRNIRLKLLESQPAEPPADAAELDTASVAVSAKACWFDTGLFLAKGKTYELSATGRWGAHTSWNDGPGGNARKANHSYPLIGPQVYDLIGHVGEQGPAFHIGEGLVLTVKHAGHLYLRMNDDGTADNWGSVRVRIHGPLLARKGAPLLSRFTKAVAKLKVGPAHGWAFSGLTLQRGDQVLITADGAWIGGPRGGPVDADGYSRTWRKQRAGALIGRIGQHGALFTAGKLHLLEAREPGKLYLAVNSDQRAQPLAPFRRLVPHPGPQGAIEAERPNLLGLWARLAAEARARERAAALRARAEVAEQARLAAEAAANRRVRPEPQKIGQDAADPAPRPAPRAPRAPQPPKAVRRNGNRGALSVTIFAPATFDREREQPKQPADLRCRLLATLRGHRSWVICVDFSPDGTRIASASRDRTVKLWDAKTGKCLKTLGGHLGTVEAVAFSPDGKRLLSTGQDRTLRLWDVTTGECVRVLRGHRDWVRSAAFFPDGKRAASTGADKTVKIWDIASGECIIPLQADSASWCVTVSPDGKKVASASEKGWIRIWDAATGHLERVIFARSNKCWRVAYSPDGKRLASAGNGRVVNVWDAATGKCLKAIEVAGVIHGLAFSPGGKYIAAGGWCRVLRLWDATTYEHLSSLEGHTSEIRGLAFSPDGKRLATASFDSTVQVWAIAAQPPDDTKPAKPEATRPPANPPRPEP